MTGPVRTFHLRTYEILEPVDFPRALFAGALTEHAHLVEAHGDEILAALIDHPGQPVDSRFVALEDLHLVATLLVARGDEHEVHRWHAVDLSYVVQRCRGIVRQLMEVPPEGNGYVVVVSGGVASLQLVRGVAPQRAGDGPRLEVVERDLVVEPWEQWHVRARRFVKTWWLTPAGDLVASRVRVRPWPADVRAVTDVVMSVRGQALRRRIDDYRAEHPRHKPLAVIDIGPRGDEITLVERFDRDPVVAMFPQIVEALRAVREGINPVVVYDCHWAGLCWLPATSSTDVAVPDPLLVRRAPQPDDDVYDDEEGEEEAASKKKREPRLRLSANARFAALFDDFPPLDPWAPRAREINYAWIAGLLLALYVGLSVVAAVELAFRWWGLFTDRPVGIAAVVLGAGGTFLCYRHFRWRLRQLDPALRRYRWRAWKQVHEETEPKKPKREPHVRGRKFWMRRLAQRLSRLERLVGLDAPEIIIDGERKLVRDAIAELEKSDADAVLAAWPTAVRHMDPPEVRREARKQGGGGGADKPN